MFRKDVFFSDINVSQFIDSSLSIIIGFYWSCFQFFPSSSNVQVTTISIAPKGTDNSIYSAEALPCRTLQYAVDIA